MLDERLPATLAVRNILIDAPADHEFSLIGLRNVGVHGVRHHHQGKTGFISSEASACSGKLSDIVFDHATRFSAHANGLACEALDGRGEPCLRRIFHSIGGGFVASTEELEKPGEGSSREETSWPYSFDTAIAMRQTARQGGKSIAEMKRANELQKRSVQEKRVSLNLGDDGPVHRPWVIAPGHAAGRVTLEAARPLHSGAARKGKELQSQRSTMAPATAKSRIARSSIRLTAAASSVGLSVSIHDDDPH